MVPAVHVVAHEQVVGVGARAADAEQLQQVLELAVDVAAHLRGTVEWGRERDGGSERRRAVGGAVRRQVRKRGYGARSGIGQQACWPERAATRRVTRRGGGAAGPRVGSRMGACKTKQHFYCFWSPAWVLPARDSGHQARAEPRAPARVGSGGGTAAAHRRLQKRLPRVTPTEFARRLCMQSVHTAQRCAACTVVQQPRTGESKPGQTGGGEGWVRLVGGRPTSKQRRPPQPQPLPALPQTDAQATACGRSHSPQPTESPHGGRRPRAAAGSALSGGSWEHTWAAGDRPIAATDPITASCAALVQAEGKDAQA